MDLASTLSALVIANSSGGNVGDFALDVLQASREGRRVEISGDCLSACTMYLAAPNVCAHEGTRFGFHGPVAERRSDAEIGRNMLRQMYRRASPALEAWFVAHAEHLGGDRFVFLSASDLRGLNAALSEC